MRAIKIACIFLCVVLASCAVKRFNSTTTNEPIVPIKVLDVYWNPVVPATYRITKSARGYQPTINDVDRMRAAATLRELYAVFQTGFQTQFKSGAQSNGITEVAVVGVPQTKLPNPSPGRHQLFVDVKELSVSCGEGSCTPIFTLTGMLRNPGSSATSLTFESLVGQHMAGSKIDASVVEAFTQAVMDDWRTKGLVR
jgi:hypothetical protein